MSASDMFAELYRELTPEERGDLGEAITLSELRKLPDTQVIDTLYMPYLDKIHPRLVQIDMIIISTMGIFVVENKNHHSIIDIDAEGNCWLSKTQKFNPVQQNAYHCLAVKDYLYSDMAKLHYDYPVYNFVIFNMLAKLRYLAPNPHIFYLDEFMQDFQLMLDTAETTVFTPEQVNLIASDLIQFQDKSVFMQFYHKLLVSDEDYGDYLTLLYNALNPMDKHHHKRHLKLLMLLSEDPKDRPSVHFVYDWLSTFI